MILEFYITYIFLIIAVILSIKGFSDPFFVEKYLFIPYRVKHNKEYYRFISHAFLHGDPGHLIFNMITLFSFGTALENAIVFFTQNQVLGKIIFLAYCLGAIIVASLISYYRHSNNYNYRSLGISGMTSAIVFTSILWDPSGYVYMPFKMPSWIFGLLYLAFEIYSDRNRKTGIAHDAHIAGAIFGILFAIIFKFDQVQKGFSLLF
ncbi:MAG: rhomboid family intramembrane serine protease [Fluviicola sp.]